MSMKKKQSFKKIQSFDEIFSEFFYFPRMVVIDVGCGTGDLVRWMTSEGAIATGIDLPEMIEKAMKVKKVGDEKYLVGTAQDMTFKECYADLIIFLASFHHVPENEMKNAVEKCYKILKPDGHVAFIEPLAQKDSYSDLTLLVDDEVEIRDIAYKYILSANNEKFKQVVESFYYMERSFQDYLSLLNVHVSADLKRDKIVKQAKELILNKKENIETVKFRSLVRLNILKKD